MAKPSYDELAVAFWEYLACSNNQGAAVLPGEDDIERAYEVLDRSGVESPY